MSHENDTLSTLSATAAVAAMQRGELSAERYADALLARCAEGAALNAFITLRPDYVQEHARAADLHRRAGGALGALHGLPIPFKDSVNTKDLPTSAGTKALLDFQPTEDAPLVATLRAQGAIVLGKTNLHEISAGYTSVNQTTGPVGNPYDPTRIPGGSSGGSAAAVAARMAPLSVAEDTGGSIRMPAAMCGIVGFRPTTGRYDSNGVAPMTALFDQLGPHARTVDDVILFDHVVTGDANPLAERPLSSVTLGVVRDYYFADLDAEVARVTADALAALQAAGVRIVEVTIPDLAALIAASSMPIILHDLAPSLSAYLARYGGPSVETVFDNLAPDMKALFAALPPIDDATYAYSTTVARPRLQELMAETFRAHALDALVFPTAGAAATPIASSHIVMVNGVEHQAVEYFSRNLNPGSTTGLPGLVLPAGLTREGLPVGLEFDGPAGSDRALLAVGRALEQALGVLPAPR